MWSGKGADKNKLSVVALDLGSVADRVVWVRALPGDIVLCSWARHFTLAVPLSIQVYKWILANFILEVTLW